MAQKRADSSVKKGSDSEAGPENELPAQQSIRRSHEDRERTRHKSTKHPERLTTTEAREKGSTNLPSARIVRSDGQYWIAELENGEEIRVKSSKRTRSADPNTTLVATGDRVLLDIEESGENTIAEVLPRATKLLRLASGRHDSYAQVIVANIDVLVIVASVLEPPLRTGIIDRYIVAGLDGGMEIAVIFNKIDLLKSKAAREVIEEYRSLYQSLGYPTFSTSVKQPDSIVALREFLAGKTSVFAGHSGVGKTSLVNYLLGEEFGMTKALSKKYRRGAHATSRSVLVRLGEDGASYIVDTPGVREFANFAIDPQTLKFYFAEFERYADKCQMTNCTHLHEPGCAVMAAVQAGEISPERYQSYEKLYAEAESAERKTREKL